jgi:hypothetical protein
MVMYRIVYQMTKQSSLLLCCHGRIPSCGSSMYWIERGSTNLGWIEESARLKEIHPGHREPLHDTIQDHESDSCGRKLLESEPVTPLFDVGKTEDRCLKRLSLVKCLLPCGR